MQNSFWKLAALVGISGLGFLTLLQVQKGLHDASRTVEVAAPAAPAEATPVAVAAPPTYVHMASVPDAAAENPFAAAEPLGIDFRDEPPAQPVGEEADSPLVRTAAVDLIPVPEQAESTVAADDPFAEVTADRAVVETVAARQETPPRQVIQPAGFESAADAPASDTAAPAGDASDFGMDPFGDLGPLSPNPVAAGLEERPEPMPAASPSDQLDTADPFADPPADTAAPEGESVPVRPIPATDDPFGTAPPATPDSGAPAPSSNETPPAQTEPLFGDSPPAADSTDPFADEPAAEPAPSRAAPAQPAPSQPAAAPDFDFGSGDTVPASGAQPPEFGVGPAPGEEAPAVDRPRLLPAEEPDDAFRGVGVVSPDDPRGPQRAELTVEKKAPERASLGEPLVYQIVVKNVGDSPAAQVTVSDLVPKGTRLEGTIPRAKMTDDKLVWMLDTLAPGASSTIKIKVVPVEPGPVGSVATVSFVSEAAARTEVIAPRLTLRLTAPPQVTLGEPVDVQFEIANRGTAPAEKVLLRDVVPAGLQHRDGNDLEYEVGTLDPGKAESITLRLATLQPGTFTNTAVVTAAGGVKTEATAAIEVVATAGRVSVTRQGPKRRYVGRPATFANIVKNVSNESVPGVKVIEQVPAGMEFVQASHGGQFDADKRTIAWQLGPLEPGREQTLQVMLTAAAEGVQDSVVRAEELDGVAAEVASATTVERFPSLAPSIQGPDAPVSVGERTAFRIRVKNRGNAEATGVAVSLGVPAELTFLGTRGGKAQVDAAGLAVVRLAAPLAPGGEQVIDFILEGAAAGTARLRAEVNAGHMSQPLVRDEELVVVGATP